MFKSPFLFLSFLKKSASQGLDFADCIPMVSLTCFQVPHIPHKLAVRTTSLIRFGFFSTSLVELFTSTTRYRTSDYLVFATGKFLDLLVAIL